MLANKADTASALMEVCSGVGETDRKQVSNEKINNFR